MKNCVATHLICRLLTIILTVTFLGTTVVASDFPFSDVSQNSPYYEAIQYCYENGVMAGTSPTTFSPDTILSRGMIVTILYSVNGGNEYFAPTGFTDVPAGSYYYYPVGWAQHYGIVAGKSSTSFAPNDPVTHEQAVAILYKYATVYLGANYSLISSSYASMLNDYSSISSYARPAVNWGLNCGIIAENTTSFYPKQGTKRELCAMMFFKYLTRVRGNGKAFSMRSLSPGTASNIAYTMGSNMGYEKCLGYDLTVREMRFALGNTGIIFSHSHGDQNMIALNDGSLSASSISSGWLSDVDLVYISACKAGATLVPTLYNTGGAQSAVGFINNITASTSSDGIHYFNLHFFQYLSTGYTIGGAIYRAKLDLYLQQGSYYGSDSAVYYGTYH